jgi:uncharacterized protein (UPF0332 family)
MVSEVSLLMDRAENEIHAAQVLKKASEDVSLKKDLGFSQESTFYSNVIGHSYYSIFYSAKAYLISKSIIFKSEQGQHQQVYFEFRKLVQAGIIDNELLNIYEEALDKAEVLLEIIKEEKKKRKTFTYETIPQANKKPAEDSIKNALFFHTHIKNFLQNSEI